MEESITKQQVDEINKGKTKENQQINEKKNKNKIRMVLVLIFILTFVAISYIQLRGSYLEYKELGENYLEVFFTNLKYKYFIMGMNFVFLYFVIYYTNRGIKKGLKVFFDKEQKAMPKLLNKSLALVISSIASVMISSIMMPKLLLGMSNAEFGIQDKIFNLDISYYMFQKPMIEMFIIYFIVLIVGLTLYMCLYYVLIFNRYFDGIDGKLLKDSLFFKKLSRNAFLVVVGIALLTILNTQNILFGKILTVNNEIDLVGARIYRKHYKTLGLYNICFCYCYICI